MRDPERWPEIAYDQYVQSFAIARPFRKLDDNRHKVLTGGCFGALELGRNGDAGILSEKEFGQPGGERFSKKNVD